MNREQKLFGSRALVIGVLASIALIILVGVTKRSSQTQDSDAAEPNEDHGAAATELPGPVEPLTSGLKVYNEACLICHDEGVGGAPVNGDASAWSARIALGNDTLYQHAIEGYTGEAGFMPAKGARLDLSDEEVRAAVDYMVDESGN